MGADKRGALPLSYAHRDHWEAWVEWLESKKGLYWSEPEVLDPILDQEPNSCPVPNPKNALTEELARMVASGRISPGEAKILMVDGDNMTENESDEDESDFEDDDDDDEDFDSDYDDDDDS